MGCTVPLVDSGHGPKGLEDVAARLDDGYEGWTAALTDNQRSAFVSWQGDDRHYDAIQAAFRDDVEVPDEVQDEIDLLDEAIRAGALPIDLVGWKGIRSVKRAFGVPTAELRPGMEFQYAGFFAFTIDRAIATPEFTHPPGPPAAGLLRMEWSEGSMLAWVAAVGDPAMRSQYELLATSGIVLRVISVTYPEGDESVPEISVEVITR